MNKTEFRLLWPFYVTALISSSFSVAVPVWVIFFQKHFSFLQISIALSLQSVAAILFEIPSGAVADVIGRKASVVTGIVLQGLLWLALPFVERDLVLYAAFFLTGLLRTLESGADKAWMVDWLKENRKGKLIREMFLKMHSLHAAGAVASSLVASLLLLSQEIRFLFFVQGCGYIIESFMLYMFAKESPHRSRKVKMGALVASAVKTTKAGFQHVARSKPLPYLLLGATLAVASKDFGCVAWQPLLVDLSLSVEYLGIVFSIAGGLGIAAPFLARFLLRRFGHESHYLALTHLIEFLILLSLWFIAKPYFVLGVVVYLFSMLLSDMQLPIMASCFQSFIPSRIRATVASLQSVLFALSSLIVTALGGFLMDRYGAGTALAFISFLLIPAALSYMMIGNRLHEREAPMVRSFWKHLPRSYAGQRWIRYAKWLAPPEMTPMIATPAVTHLTKADARRNVPSLLHLRLRTLCRRKGRRMYHHPASG